MTTESLRRLAIEALEELKAVDIQALDVSRLTTITDIMIIASGTSSRQVRALSDNLIRKAKNNGIKGIGVEGEKDSEWVLVDLGDVIVHIMSPDTRAYYQLEKLWATDQPRAGQSS